jgi:hypothetical protein
MAWELALLGAILLHVPVLFCRLPTVPPPDRSVTRRPHCTFLEPGLPMKESESELLAWAELADPTILSLPNTGAGFSSWLRQRPARPYTPSPSPAATPVSIPSRPPAPPPEKVIPALAEGFRQEWRVSIPDSPQAPPAPELPAGVVWRFGNGAPLPGMAEVAPADLRVALAAGVPRQPTRLRVHMPENGAARVRLLTSCGNADLDRLARRLLGSRILAWEQAVRRRESSPETEPFLQDAARNRVVEVEWRLALGGGGG